MTNETTASPLTEFERMDHNAMALKSEAKTLGMLAVIFLASFILIPAFNGPGQAMFDLNRVPWFLMVGSPLLIVASVAASALACRYVNRKTAENKAAYRRKLDAIATTIESIEVDDSGPTPKLKQKVA